jgi:hypothetical protein
MWICGRARDWTRKRECGQVQEVTMSAAPTSGGHGPIEVGEAANEGD